MKEFTKRVEKRREWRNIQSWLQRRRTSFHITVTIIWILKRCHKTWNVCCVDLETNVRKKKKPMKDNWKMTLTLSRRPYKEERKSAKDVASKEGGDSLLNWKPDPFTWNSGKWNTTALKPPKPKVFYIFFNETKSIFVNKKKSGFTTKRTSVKMAKNKHQTRYRIKKCCSQNNMRERLR